MEHQIQIKGYWTDAPSAQLKNNFIHLANSVFGTFVTEEYYRAKFEDNVYGPSLITIAFVDGQPAGADVMWRNDLQNIKAFQTVDTCVLGRFRGMGIFKRMTQWELELLGESALVYGFPNANSFPGYVKMGWRVKHLYKTPVLLGKGNGRQGLIEGAYAAWWLKAQPDIESAFKNGKYYLIRKKKKHALATLLGQVDETTASLFPSKEGVCLSSSFETKSSIYNKNKFIPLVCNQPTMEIPYWKIDAI